MKEFLKKHKKEILKIGIMLVVLVAISIVAYFVLRAFGITDIDTLRELIKSCGAWARVVFLILQVLCTILLCFIPGTSMLFISVGVVLFDANYKAFLLCFCGVIISSVLMDLLGRFGIDKLIKKLIGEEDLKKATNLINKYGKTYIPLFYLLPLFPDDAICCVCGAMKINFWYHLASIILCRGIGVATIVFGISILPPINSIWDFVEVATIIVFWVILLFYVATKINKYIERKKNNEK